MTKKICIILLLALLLTGCRAPGDTQQNPTDSTTLSTSDSTESTEDHQNQTQSTTLATQEQPKAPVISPDTVGIYIPAEDGTRARKRVETFQAKRTAKKDIDCFEILASNEELVKGSSFASIWKGTWDAHPDNETTKIGFKIEFTLTDGQVISKQLLTPSDSREFFDYLEIYMYDDIHQTPGVWYTHLEDKDMKEETIISSIKLTAGSKIDQVGDIMLTAFLYNGADCFDLDGNYIGLVSDTIVITE